jgi:hypothetical protein
MSQSFSRACNSAISTGSLVWSRTRAVTGLKTEATLPGSRASASQSIARYPNGAGNVIAAVPPLGSGSLAVRSFEALTRSCAQALTAIFSQDKGHIRLIPNLSRPQTTAGKCFSFGTLNQLRQKSLSVLTVCFSPTPLHVVALSHAHTEAWSRTHDEQRKSVKGA